MVLSIGLGQGCISYAGDLTSRLDGSAARAFFHGKVQAPNEKKSHTQCQRAYEQGDENGRDNCEFYRRGALFVETQRFQMTAHDQPNLIIAVRVIGVGKVLLILRPGNNGV